VGKQKDGTYFEHSSKTGEVQTQEQELWIIAKNDSTARMNFKNQDKQIDVKMDVAGDEALTLAINNDKAIIHVMHDGNVTVETTDGVNIKLGGKGKEQYLVTKNWVDQVFKTHMHLNGNQGAPTGLLVIDNTIPSTVDSASGHFTFTTKAE
jgi:hypothetical protein